MVKPKVAFFGMTSCKGCYFQLLLANEKLPAIFERLDITDFWMLNEKPSGEDYDIAIIDGAVSNHENAELVREVRKKARYVIAYGSCACLGGIPALRNPGEKQHNAYHKMVYGKDIAIKSYPHAEPVHKHIHVDYMMFGCPVNENEVVRVITDLLLGKVPKEPDYPVCVECKKNGTTCLFKKGEVCLGPVTRGGCGAPCPAIGTPCDGCRGPSPDANMDEMREIMKSHGMKKRETELMLTKYTGGDS
ncbi:MAG: NADH:ubiquinone oxidoreductase [Candidatus Aenigmarchaeota archaeon]|nr:NADH:ubiquinone oxidoreductase [Candidatus Aenigmarchaeota archaeon]